MAKNNITVIVLTSSGKDGSDTVNKIGVACKKFGNKFYAISTQFAYIDDRTATRESITIQNYDGTGKSVTLDPRNVVCFARGGVTNTQIGMAILTIFENTGMFVINERRPMELCANKLYSAIQLDTYKIPTPKTAFVANLSSLDDALEKIGNKFPVIVKTLTGAEGVGVSIVDSYESLKSVLQTLWKYKAELLIQEYLEIKNDVRVLVLDGKVVAAAMRGKAPKDFRTNLAQGAEGGPYELNDKEREIAEHAASAFGCYYVGVDMVTSGGKPYVIELNASPGSGNVYRSYFPGSKGKAITGQRLIDSVVEHAIDRENWHFNHREAGLIEPITIENIGKFDAKLDTGNESYNVLGAENIEEFNGTVRFKMQGKQYELPVVAHTRIRTNNIHVDRRPVVELDVEFRNRKFRNVRFSLVPRSLNKYKVLIGNKFMNLAKISVNVNAINTLPEHAVSNHYVQKINTLNSYMQIDEMHDILFEKLQLCKDPRDAALIDEALNYIDVAKYNLKNKQHQAYDRNTIMHADKKFVEFLENRMQRNTNDALLNESALLSEARKKAAKRARAASKSRKRKTTRKPRKSRSILKSQMPTLADVKSGRVSLSDYRAAWNKSQRALDRANASARRKMGITTRKERGQTRHFEPGMSSKELRPYRRKELEKLYKVKNYKSKAPTEYSPETAAVRFWNYRLPGNPRRDDYGKPIQSGARRGVIDGNIKGRFKRYYKKNSERIRGAVANKISRGEWPSPGGWKGLQKGWAMRWKGHKKKKKGSKKG
jgi:RimK family alpha-L-glutamate ligase